LARAPAAREGQVIVCEGYTDTIALHQAGMRNAVGLMGTALTGDQVGELARMAPTVLLALDADSSGQEAMLRASALAAKRKLELRVVELPLGTDPADLLQREGADAMRALVGGSVPFVRFRVERVLAEGDHASAEGRDLMIERLRPAFDALPASAKTMRMELMQIVSDRLNLPPSLVERALAAGGTGSPAQAGRRQEAARNASGERARRGASTAATATAASSLGARGSSTERAFLALCIASPGAGEQALRELDLAESFTSDLARRAAEYLRDRLAEP